jgi:hypothetical protein
VSFTAEVKDELSRVEGPRAVELAQVAAMTRTCGTLQLSGQHRFKLSFSTETGAVARAYVKGVRGVFGLATQLTPRRSVLHKTHNYLITIAEQPELVDALVEMGVLTEAGGLASTIEERLVAAPECAAAYLRGSFMAGGFVASPRAEMHFEFVSTTYPFAESLAAVARRLGAAVHVGRRRASFVVYTKATEEALGLLRVMGASRAAAAVEGERAVRSVRNETNRLVNAELANQRKVAGAAGQQVELIEAVIAEVGLDRLPPALADFCDLRLSNPELSLRELGELCDPPLSRSAVHHRVRRLEGLLAEIREKRGDQTVQS